MKKSPSESFYDACVGGKSTIANMFNTLSGANYMRKNGIDLDGYSYALSGVSTARQMSGLMFSLLGGIFLLSGVTSGHSAAGVTIFAGAMAINGAVQWTSAAFMVGKHRSEQRKLEADRPVNEPEPKYRP